MSSKTKRLAFLSAALGLALILAYLESLIPVFLPIPGAKIGLPNIVSLIMLILYGFPTALAIVVGRVVLSAFLFGSLSSMLYAMAGGILSLCIMWLIRHWFKKVSVIFISIIGAVAHNCGQLIVAAGMVQNAQLLLYYLPYLLLLAIPAGFVIGLVVKLCLPKLQKIIQQQ